MAVPFLSYADIVRRAREIHHQHNDVNELCVDIEKIIYNAYRIDIYPSPGLMDRFQIDAYQTRWKSRRLIALSDILVRNLACPKA